MGHWGPEHSLIADRTGEHYMHSPKEYGDREWISTLSTIELKHHTGFHVVFLRFADISPISAILSVIFNMDFSCAMALQKSQTG